MSLAAPDVLTRRASDRRTALVDALATIDGITAGSVAPDVATPGGAWPRWVQTTYSGHLDLPAADDYDVFVVLPADYLATTVDEGDRLRDLVEAALWHVAVITYCEPVSIAFADNQNMPGIRCRVVI